MKNTSAFVNDYTVSADGKEITLNIGVASSAGYIRDVAVHQQQGEKLYLDCYSAFGGLNGSIGAKESFTFELNDDTTIIAIYRILQFTELILRGKSLWNKGCTSIQEQACRSGSIHKHVETAPHRQSSNRP